MLEKYTVGEDTKLSSKSYRYKTEAGEISMIKPCLTSMNRYEIFSIEGDLFFDIERYDTIEETEELLN